MLTLFFAWMMSFAHAERPLAPRPGAFNAGATFSYYKTTANFTDGGSSKSLFNGAQLTNMTGDATLAYDFSRALRASAGLSYGQTSTDSNNLFGTGNVGRSNSGVNEAHASALGWFNFGTVTLAPQADFIYPFWRVNEQSDSPLLGEGAMVARLGGWALVRLDMFTPFAYVGYAYRDSRRSALLPYSVGLHVKPGIWWVQAEYRGFTSVSSDGDSQNRLTRESYLTRINGGSLRNYSVEPSGGEAVLEAGVRLAGHFNLMAGYSLNVNGSRYADGSTIYAGLSYSGFMGGSSDKRVRLDEHPEEFEAEKNSYDESLFRNEPIEDEPKKKIQRKPRKAQPGLDKLMNETERTLQE